MKLYTSRYGNRKLATRHDLLKVSLSLGLPRWPVKYEISSRLKPLAPEGQLFHVHDRERFKALYYTKMDGLGVEYVRGLLEETSDGRDLVLLCFEDLRGTGKWCHRRVFAEWWQDRTGETVEDLEPVFRQASMI